MTSFIITDKELAPIRHRKTNREAFTKVKEECDNRFIASPTTLEVFRRKVEVYFKFYSKLNECLNTSVFLDSNGNEVKVDTSLLNSIVSDEAKSELTEVTNIVNSDYSTANKVHELVYLVSACPSEVDIFIEIMKQLQNTDAFTGVIAPKDFIDKRRYRNSLKYLNKTMRVVNGEKAFAEKTDTLFLHLLATANSKKSIGLLSSNTPTLFSTFTANGSAMSEEDSKELYQRISVAEKVITTSMAFNYLLCDTLGTNKLYVSFDKLGSYCASKLVNQNVSFRVFDAVLGLVSDNPEFLMLKRTLEDFKLDYSGISDIIAPCISSNSPSLDEIKTYIYVEQAAVGIMNILMHSVSDNLADFRKLVTSVDKHVAHAQALKSALANSKNKILDKFLADEPFVAKLTDLYLLWLSDAEFDYDNYRLSFNGTFRYIVNPFEQRDLLSAPAVSKKGLTGFSSVWPATVLTYLLNDILESEEIVYNEECCADNIVFTSKSTFVIQSTCGERLNKYHTLISEFVDGKYLTEVTGTGVVNPVSLSSLMSLTAYEPAVLD